MARHELYTIAQGKSNSEFVCRKVYFDYEPTGSYEISESPSGNLECSCFASNKPTCRHRTMVRLFQKEGLIGSHRWYNFDKEIWIPPVQET